MTGKLNLPKEPMFKGPALLWKRILAFLIDILILDFIVGYPFRKVIYRIMPNNGFLAGYDYLASNPSVAGLLSTIMIFFGILVLLYFAILEHKIGQTIGKMFMNIRVESVQKDVSFLSAIIRNMYFVFVFPFVLLWLVDPVFLLFTKDKRRLSEILSRTRTVAVYTLN